MVTHILISDTHAPDIIEDIYAHLKSFAIPHHNPDAIVINGDLIGVFSMTGGNVYKARPMTVDDQKRYLQLGSPNFFAKYGIPNQLTGEMVHEYIAERYDWVLSTLTKFSQLKHTIFNMGNHESPHHFIVMHELPFLTGAQLPADISMQRLLDIFAAHEQQLEDLEQQGNFTYVRHKPFISGDVVCMPIPGEHHDAVGPAPQAVIQENKTKALIEMTMPLLKDAKTLVIYNHTLGSYNRMTGMFSPTSPAAIQLLQSVPSHIKNTVWVQSHNHWSHTQFLQAGNTHFILNNAGLHGGIYNVVEFGDEVKVFDVHPDSPTSTELTVSEEHVNSADVLKIIQRNYPNFLDIFVQRKTALSAHIQPTTK